MAYPQGGRMMAESRTFEALFPGARGAVLTALFAEPGRWWTLEELAGRAGVRPGSIHGQLVRLRQRGIVREDRKAAYPRFQPDPGSQVFAELQAIVTKLTSSNGSETILVVEDTTATAQITRILLESWGYCALEAHTPGEALNLFDSHAGEIHLVLTDVMMPQMSGTQLADELRRRDPGVRVMFMSGDPDHESAGPNEFFLAKPFNPAGLSQMVRKALDGAAAPCKRINGR
jgi:CheY-like chemotaxis protein